MNTIISPEGLEEIRKAATARGWVQRGGADWFDPADENGQPWPAPGIRICWHSNGKEVSVFGEKTVIYPLTAPVTDALAAIERLHPLPAEPAKEATDEDVVAHLRAIGATSEPRVGRDVWRLGDNPADLAIAVHLPKAFWLVRAPGCGWSSADMPAPCALDFFRRHYPLPAEPVPDPAPTPPTVAPIEGSVAAVAGPSEWVLGEWEEGTHGTPDSRRWVSSDAGYWWGAASTAGYVRARPTGIGGGSVGGPILINKPGATRDECDAVLREHGYLPPLVPEPTVGSPEGRALIDAEARLRGWVQDADADWREEDRGPGGHVWRVVFRKDLGAVFVLSGEPDTRIPLDRPVSEAIAAIRRLYPLPDVVHLDPDTYTAADVTVGYCPTFQPEVYTVASADFAAKVLTVTLPEGWRLDDATIDRIEAPIRHERDTARTDLEVARAAREWRTAAEESRRASNAMAAKLIAAQNDNEDLRARLGHALTSIREATHTLATALDHDTESAMALEAAAVEVVRRWRRDNETWTDAVDLARRDRDTARTDLADANRRIADLDRDIRAMGLRHHDEFRAIDEALGYHEGSTRSDGDRTRAIQTLIAEITAARKSRDAATERADLAEQARKEAVDAAEAANAYARGIAQSLAYVGADDSAAVIVAKLATSLKDAKTRVLRLTGAISDALDDDVHADTADEVDDLPRRLGEQVEVWERNALAQAADRPNAAEAHRVARMEGALLGLVEDAATKFRIRVP